MSNIYNPSVLMELNNPFHHTVNGFRNPANQLRLVVYLPLFKKLYTVFIHPTGGWTPDFWTINGWIKTLHLLGCACTKRRMFSPPSWPKASLGSFGSFHSVVLSCQIQRLNKMWKGTSQAYFQVLYSFQAVYACILPKHGNRVVSYHVFATWDFHPGFV